MFLKKSEKYRPRVKRITTILTLCVSLKNLGMKRSEMDVRYTRFVHIDTAQLEENHEFQLTIAPAPVNAGLGENYYKLKLLEHPLEEVYELSLFSGLLYTSARRSEISLRMFNSSTILITKC